MSTANNLPFKNDVITNYAERFTACFAELGRIRKWGYIKEVDKYLRIVVLEDGETVHNAFFDRDFKR